MKTFCTIIVFAFLAALAGCIPFAPIAHGAVFGIGVLCGYYTYNK